MDIISLGILVAIFIAIASIPFTVYLHKGILRSFPAKKIPFALLMGYVGLILINIGMMVFFSLSARSVLKSAGIMQGLGELFGVLQIALFLVIASLIEGIITVKFLKKYKKFASPEIIVTIIIFLLTSGVLMFFMPLAER